MKGEIAGLVLFLACATGCVARRAEPVEEAPRASAEMDPRVMAALAFASAQVGKRYCWGGTGPSCFDCSGLVQASWNAAGIKLPRTAVAQGKVLVDVAPDDVRPGDILWWPTHVGLYAGEGEMIDAVGRRAGVVRRRAVAPDRILRVVPAPTY